MTLLVKETRACCGRVAPCRSLRRGPLLPGRGTCRGGRPPSAPRPGLSPQKCPPVRFLLAGGGLTGREAWRKWCAGGLPRWYWGYGPQKVQGLTSAAGAAAAVSLLCSSRSASQDSITDICLALGDGWGGGVQGLACGVSLAWGSGSPALGARKPFGDPASVRCSPRLGCRNAGQRCPGAPARWARGERLPLLPLFS